MGLNIPISNRKGPMMQYDYIAHYGIKGQKWGIRRYQNPDGTLTPEGRKRKQFKNPIKSVSERMNRRRKYPLTDTRKLTDDELDTKLRRLRKERELQKLERELNQSALSRGANMVFKLLSDSASNSVSNLMRSEITRQIEEALDLKKK